MAMKKTGRIKKGEGALIGNAGEYYVMAELLKKGVVAGLAPRNAMGFDILATHKNKRISIRVKTKSAQYDSWPWMAKKDGEIFRHLSNKNDFLVLVNLPDADEHRRPNFYIAPSAVIDNWLRKRHEKWLKTPGRHGQPHNDSAMRRLPEVDKHGISNLKPYLENWNSLWK
jgi:hypothetical protein